jgi:tricarballylate dehydrogenase
VLLKDLIAQGADEIGDATQAHMVAIDARAPLYDGGITTRVDCVSLGIVVNRDGHRFYDEGEDFWPKRYAIWGRLVALQPGQVGHSIIDAKAVGRFMPPVFKGAQADTLEGLADSSWACRRAAWWRRCAPSTPPAARHLRPRGARRLPYRRPEPAQDALGAPIDTPPFYGYTLQPGITFTYLGVKVDAGRGALRRSAQPQPVRRRRSDGRQRAGPGVHGGCGHDHRHGVRRIAGTSAAAAVVRSGGAMQPLLDLVAQARSRG